MIALGEFRFGIAQSRRHEDYENWLLRLIAVSRVLEIDERTTRHYAEARVELQKAGDPTWLAYTVFGDPFATVQ